MQNLGQREPGPFSLLLARVHSADGLKVGNLTTPKLIPTPSPPNFLVFSTRTKPWTLPENLEEPCGRNSAVGISLWLLAKAGRNRPSAPTSCRGPRPEGARSRTRTFLTGKPDAPHPAGQPKVS